MPHDDPNQGLPPKAALNSVRLAQRGECVVMEQLLAQVASLRVPGCFHGVKFHRFLERGDRLGNFAAIRLDGGQTVPTPAMRRT